MSDLAKKCAEAIRRENSYCNAQMGVTVPEKDEALAAFIEAAQAVRDECGRAGIPALGTVEKYDAALRDLAQSMEVE